MMMDFKIAYQYLMGRKLRSFMTTLAIVFGVLLIFMLSSIIPTFMDAFKSSLMQSADKVDLTIHTAVKGTFDDSYLEKVASNSQVKAFTGTLEKIMILPSGSIHRSAGTNQNDALQELSMITLKGIDPQSYELVKHPEMVSGNYSNLKGHAIFVGDATAERYLLQMNDTIELPTANGVQTMIVSGIFKEKAVMGSPALYTALDTAQNIIESPHQLSQIDVLFKSGTDQESTSKTLLEQLGPQFASGAVEAGTEFVTAIQMGEKVFTMLGMIALMVGGFIILITFRTLVVERRHDIGLLRAIGASRSKILRLILAEGLLQGIIGTAFGLLFGYLATLATLSAIGGMWEKLAKVPLGAPSFSLGSIITAIALGLGTTLISGLLPALSASKLTPLEALSRSKAQELSKGSKLRRVLGVIFFIGGPLLLLSSNFSIQSLGLISVTAGAIMLSPTLVRPITAVMTKVIALIYYQEGHIAGGNLDNNPKRSAMTANTVMIGLAMLLATYALATSLIHSMDTYMEKSVGSDFMLIPQSIVLSGGNLGVPESFTQSLLTQSEISAATSLRISFGHTANSDLQALGIDPYTYPKLGGLDFSSGDESAFEAMKDGKHIIINGILASTLKAKAGEDLTLKTPTGEHTYTIAAIGNDFINMKLATVYVSQEVLKKDFNETKDILILVNKKADSDWATAEDQLKKATANYPNFTVVNSQTYKNDLKNQVESMMILIYVLVGAIALPSMIALINTLSISVLERTREIGIMKAIGAENKQIRRIILSESMLLASIGTFLSIIVGLVAGYVFVGSLNAIGYHSQYLFPIPGLIMVLVIGILFGFIGAWLPAKHAMRLNIISALKYE